MNKQTKQNGLEIILTQPLERCDRCGKSIIKNQNIILMTRPTRFFCNEFCYAEHRRANNRLEAFLDSLAVFN